MNENYSTWRDVPESLWGWHLTRHARERIVERGFRRQQIERALLRPRTRYPSSGHGAGCWIYKSEPVALAVHEDSRVVITVLLASWGRWSDDDARRANGAAA